MNKYCKMCGAELRNKAEFCHKCGAVQSSSPNNVVDDVGNNDYNKKVNDNKKTTFTNRIKVYIGVLVVIALLLGKGYVAFHSGSGLLERVKGALNIGAAQVTTETESSASTNAPSSKETIPINTAANQAEPELKQHGIQGTVVASSKGHNNSGYVSLVNNNGQYQIVTYDIKNGRVGTTPYDRSILYFTDKKSTGSGNETIIFNMTV
ncbi:zinc ribbon domain-containing protein, partial [Anaerovibrio lipolyticus]|uniref:zinc-ribbon domain-containing protein n=1 Tax=Anaerovibrio lipolyticus TaxID=82374 RepID=UPI0023EF853A